MAAYNNYFPASYQPMYMQPQIQQPMQTPMQPQQTYQVQGGNSSINWVQGESAARAFSLAPNQSALLMDSDANVFYLKSTDASGMPLPLRIFDYTERTQQHAQNQIQTGDNAQQQTASQEYITREEFEQRIAELSNQSFNRKKNYNSNPSKERPES